MNDRLRGKLNKLLQEAAEANDIEMVLSVEEALEGDVEELVNCARVLLETARYELDGEACSIVEVLDEEANQLTAEDILAIVELEVGEVFHGSIGGGVSTLRRTL